jgi:hypothetical protein
MLVKAMPLKSGKSAKVRSDNIGELIRTYKEKGKIGNTTPHSAEHARHIAVAIAYSKQRGRKKR